MNISDKIKICRQCTNKKFDPKQGIICGLTGEKPSFEFECPHFNKDEKISQKTPLSYSYKDSSKRGGCLTILLVLIIIGSSLNIIASFVGLLVGKGYGLLFPQYYYIFGMLHSGLALAGAILMIMWKKTGVYLYAFALFLNLISLMQFKAHSPMSLIGWIIGIIILFAVISPKWDNFK